jgi:hypothetical protein
MMHLQAAFKRHIMAWANMHAWVYDKLNNNEPIELCSDCQSSSFVSRVDFGAVNRVRLNLFLGVVDLISTVRKDVFVLLVESSRHNFARVRVLLLHSDVRQQAHVSANVELKQRTRLATRLVDDKVVESVVL